MNGISAFIRRDMREMISLSLCHVRIQQEDGHLQTKKKALTRPLQHCHLHLRLPSLAINLCCFSKGSFVIAARAYEDAHTCTVVPQGSLLLLLPTVRAQV